MAYKKSIKLKFESQEEYKKIEKILSNANIEVQAFATFAFNRVWTEVVQEHERQLAKKTALEDTAEALSEEKAEG